MKLTANDLPARLPVWSALADFYLDTDVDSFYPSAAAVIARSPYSMGEIRYILFEEVHPAVICNLSSLAGEWLGFDEDWLKDRILMLHRSPWRRWTESLRWREIRRDLWQELAPRITAIRASTAPSGVAEKHENGSVL
jgi:hypothetical protein